MELRRDGPAAAMWCAIARLVAFEELTRIRTRATPRQLALGAGIGAAMGLAMLVPKIAPH